MFKAIKQRLCDHDFEMGHTDVNTTFETFEGTIKLENVPALVCKRCNKALVAPHNVLVSHIDTLEYELERANIALHTDASSVPEDDGGGDSAEDGEYKATEYPTCPECHSTRVFMEGWIRYCWDCYQDGRKMVAVIDPISKSKPSDNEQVTLINKGVGNQ